MRANLKCRLPNGAEVIVATQDDARSWIQLNQSLLLSLLLDPDKWPRLFNLLTLEEPNWPVLDV